jgi:hypothetical protein
MDSAARRSFIPTTPVQEVVDQVWWRMEPYDNMEPDEELLALLQTQLHLESPIIKLMTAFIFLSPSSTLPSYSPMMSSSLMWSSKI